MWDSDEASRRALLREHREAPLRAGMLWVPYPKGNRADINRDTPWPILAEPGLRPIGQVAMAETWSALRPLKEGEPSRSSAADA